MATDLVPKNDNRSDTQQWEPIVYPNMGTDLVPQNGNRFCTQKLEPIWYKNCKQMEADLCLKPTADVPKRWLELVPNAGAYAVPKARAASTSKVTAELIPTGWAIVAS